MINAFLRRMYKYNFVSECFSIDAVMVDMDKNFLKRCFPQPTVCILYSLLSKAIHTGSAPGIITFICQFVTPPILGATLLLYAAFIGLNRFAVLSVRFFLFLLSASIFVCMFYCLFYFCTIALVTAFISVACTSVTYFSIKYSNTQIRMKSLTDCCIIHGDWHSSANLLSVNLRIHKSTVVCMHVHTRITHTYRMPLKTGQVLLLSCQ